MTADVSVPPNGEKEAAYPAWQQAARQAQAEARRKREQEQRALDEELRMVWQKRWLDIVVALGISAPPTLSTNGETLLVDDYVFTAAPDGVPWYFLTVSHLKHPGLTEPVLICTREDQHHDSRVKLADAIDRLTARIAAGDKDKPARKLSRIEIDARDLARQVVEAIETGRPLTLREERAIDWLAWLVSVPQRR